MADDATRCDVGFCARVGGGFSGIVRFIEDGGFNLHGQNLSCRARKSIINSRLNFDLYAFDGGTDFASGLIALA
jgi:hypothetical protein